MILSMRAKTRWIVLDEKIPKREGRGGKMDKIKVLLVDDEEDFVKALAERIDMRDLNSEVALNGEQALQIVEDEVPDVMVLDLRMPGIDGIEVLRRVKKAYPKVQVVILTGHGSDKDEKEARKLGAFEYLQKPVDIDHLVKTLKKAYRKRMEDAMVAATFAEAGDYKTAKEVMEEEEKRKDSQRRDP
jgi:DNA-binding NtrC family response regulator